MQRTFAGILGSTAFTITVIRGWALGGDAPAVIPRAAAALLLFAVLGAAAGRVALWLVDEGVAARFRDELERHKTKPQQPRRA